MLVYVKQCPNVACVVKCVPPSLGPVPSRSRLRMDRWILKVVSLCVCVQVGRLNYASAMQVVLKTSGSSSSSRPG
ncbi:hypothetical protein VTH06DRAFT_2976 [Thermothelomyces fergusii]